MECKMELTPIDMMHILGESNCPICGQFILVHTIKSDNFIITSTAYCKRCNYIYSIDRSWPVPYELLSGHVYTKLDPIYKTLLKSILKG